jgi:hypothetical protein
LFLQKPTRTLAHEGGRRIARDSEEYRILVSWIEAGAPFGVRGLVVEAIHVEPPGPLVLRPGERQSLEVRATLSDGRVESVGRHALFSSNDDGMVEVDGTGGVTALRSGVTAILVRYGGKLTAVRVGVPFTEEARGKRSFRERNFIDRAASSEWALLGLRPSPPADDLTFLRRLHLDLTGRLPPADRIKAFAGDASRQKHERMIDALLASPEFVDYWTMKFADLLLISSKRLGAASAQAYHHWVRQQVAANTPLDHLVGELLSTLGDPEVDGAANLARLTQDPRDMGEFVAQAFLGARLACARCHNHPVDRWTMEDYHGFAAFFARVGVDQGRVGVRDFGEIQHPRTGELVAARVLQSADKPAVGSGGVRRIPAPWKGERKQPGLDPRVRLAEWMVSPENPMFARAWANRIWKELLGRGLVEPIDDLRSTNPASIPALLDALAGELIASGFDMRHLIREIARSSVYRLDATTDAVNRADDRLFSHAYLKPITGPVLADVLAQALGLPDAFADQPSGTRAVQLIDPQSPSYTLDVLGRCPRTSSCEPASSRGGGLSQALHLIQGPVINDKLPEAAARLLAESRTDREFVETIYLRTLSRPPTRAETRTWVQQLRERGERQEIAEDLLWALLNSREFAMNH